jgi:hypothetical protein
VSKQNIQIFKPAKATTQAQTSFKGEKFQIISKEGEPIKCGSKRAFERIMARKQELNNVKEENGLYA